MPAQPPIVADDSPTSPPSRRIERRTVRDGLVLNVLGAAAPALAGVAFIPPIVAGLGPARFGVLSLAWVFINSIGILDLGIGRALTRFLAVRSEPDPAREAAVVWTSLAVLLAVGACAAAAAWGLSAPLAARLAHGDAALGLETAAVLRVLALSVPAVMLSSGLRGVLEAFGRFDLTNRVSIPMTLLNLALPAALLRLAGASLLAIVWTLVLLRAAGTLALLQSVVAANPAMRRPRLRAPGLRAVLAFGGWVTVSYLPGPLFAQAERYLLGAFATLSAVAFFSTPVDVLTRVTVIPGAVLQVLFPVLAQTIERDRGRAALLAERALLVIAAAVLPALCVLVAVAPEALRLWVGADFAAHATRAARLVALATLMNSLDWLAFSVVQSAGHASWTGKLRAVEVPLYLLVAAALIRARGVEGAALAVLLRAAVDGGVLVWMATRVVGPGGRIGRLYALVVAMAALTMAGASAPVGVGLRLAWCGVALAGAAAVGWRLLDPGARGALVSRAAAAWGRAGLT
jgi:O-antigen/teichoic acid export membrane protein